MAEFFINSEVANCVAPPDRRQSPRLQCRLPIEIRTKDMRFAVRGETTDLSVTGCYVSTMQTMAVGAEIEFRCWVGPTAIDCKAVIRTSDPNVGNGIEFVDLDEASAAVLTAYLDRLQTDELRFNEPTGIIRARM